MAEATDRLQASWLRRWATDHARGLVAAAGRLWREPGASILTAAAIGVTLALPAALHVLVRNASAVSHSWEGSLQASLFLKDSVTAERGRALAGELQRRPGVARTSYVSREQSLREFRELSGFGEALDLLEDNPLPAVIVITPQRQLPQGELNSLVQALAALPEVELAKLDQKWLDRLYAILAIIQRAVLILAGLLGLAVMVTIGNTIRLEIEARREEILVMKLIGAPDSFIRRPFLYAGFWYGLAGGVLAWLLVTVAVLALAGPARQLAGLYDSGYRLAGLDFRASLLLLGGGVLLGTLGAAWTVARQLGRYEPR